jgi:hypothetical protein
VVDRDLLVVCSLIRYSAATVDRDGRGPPRQSARSSPRSAGGASGKEFDYSTIAPAMIEKSWVPSYCKA